MTMLIKLTYLPVNQISLFLQEILADLLDLAALVFLVVREDQAHLHFQIRLEFLVHLVHPDFQVCQAHQLVLVPQLVLVDLLLQVLQVVLVVQFPPLIYKFVHKICFI